MQLARKWGGFFLMADNDWWAGVELGMNVGLALAGYCALDRTRAAPARFFLAAPEQLLPEWRT